MGLLKHLLKVLVLSVSIHDASAFWRLPCRGRVGLGMMDPIVSFNEVSSHVHTIHGGGNFGLGATSDILRDSECTSCGVKQDNSAYWTPTLHFMYPNGTTVLVEAAGGMLAYYLLYGNAGEQISAFPSGFQMISGDNFRRNFTCAVPEPPKSLWTGYEETQPALAQKAIGFNCLNYVDAAKTEPSLMRHYMPDKQFLDQNCINGTRFELMFPSCWNGKDVTSPDHKSHMAFPTQVMTGTCPQDFGTRLPSLFYETIWRTDLFIGIDGQFVIANGDPTGYGYHGDFIEGWETGFLQKAVDTCTNPSGNVQDCPIFDLISDADAGQCTMKTPPEIAQENAAAPHQGLPGNNPVQSGPSAATAGTAPSTSVPSSVSSASGSSSSFSVSSAATPASSSSTIVVPSASLPGILATDSAGGGLVVAAALTSSTSSLNAGIASAVPSLEHVKILSDSLISSAPAASVSAAAPTELPYTMMTKGGAAWKIFEAETVITVTASQNPIATSGTDGVKRRHFHAHGKHNHIG